MRRALDMIVMLCLLIAPLRAAAQKAELGIMSSPRSAGIALLLSGKGGSRSLIRTYVDLYKVIDGTCKSPGYKIDYHILYPLFDRSCPDGLSFHLSAGPGVTAGYVRDRGKEIGAAAGLSGVVSIAIVFRSVTVSAGFSAALGCHMNFSNIHENTLEFYKNGVYQSYIPEITIRYRFR